jgi:hypothetical protein
MMILYHVTARARDILDRGFRDNVSYEVVTKDGQTTTLTGVIVTDQQPIDKARGDLLVIDLPDTVVLDEYQIVDDSPPGWRREWCVPADVLNREGRVRLLTDDEPRR